MLTTIPWNEFIALTKGVKEDGSSSKKPFNWDEMLEHRNSFKELNKYISETDCKFVGEGSARIAYFLPIGAYDTEYLNEPSCFKIAKDKGKSIAQNKAEINILEKYSYGKLECFPKLYDWDGDNCYFLLCEIGTSARDFPDDEMDIYLAEWDRWIKKHYPKYLEYISVSSLHSLFNTLDWLFENISAGKDDGDAAKAVIQEMANDIPKYKGIADFITFMFDKGGLSEVSFGDFSFSDNWGMVMRNGSFTMIPIDYGFTKEVANKYY